MNEENLTGIERCIAEAGGQTALANKVKELTGRPVAQGHVSHWKKAGYVAELYREAVLVASNYIVDESELRKSSPLKLAANG